MHVQAPCSTGSKAEQDIGTDGVHAGLFIYCIYTNDKRQHWYIKGTVSPYKKLISEKKTYQNLTFW